MDALNRAGLSGPVDLARANPQAYGRSFQEALKNGASYDQALMKATSDAVMKVVGNQVPMGTLLYNIGGDPNKAVSVIGGALNRAGISMTHGELNLLGIVAAEASAYQRDAAFQTKVALEKLKGLPNEKAWTAASETLWQEATDRVIAFGDFGFDLEGKDEKSQQTTDAIDGLESQKDNALTNPGETDTLLTSEQAKEKGFQDLLENAKKGDIIESAEQVKLENTYRIFQTPEEINDFFYNDGEERNLKTHSVSKQVQWEKSLAPQELNAIQNYTGIGYRNINTFLQGTNNLKGLQADFVQQQIDGLDSAISRFELKENIRVQRGVPNSLIDRLTLENNVQASVSELVGKKYVEKGFSSTTVLHGNKAATAKPTVLDIEIPAGKGRGAYINQFAGDSRDTEYEFLIKRGASFTIKEVQEERFMGEDYYYIRLVMDD